jgi:hypothetical protein
MPTVLRQLIVWIVALAFLGQAVGFSQPAQAIPLQLKSLASADVVTLLDSNNHKTLGKDNEYVSLAAEAVDKGSSVKELAFSDTDQFYKELTDALKSGEPVNIITDYTSYDDFPPRLKQIFKLDADSINIAQAEKHPSPLWAVGAASGIASYAAPAAATLDSKWLIIPVSTAVGAGAGGGFGGLAGGIGAIPGTLLGGAFGLAAGAVTVAIIDKDEVWFEINPTRGITITIRPVNS